MKILHHFITRMLYPLEIRPCHVLWTTERWVTWRIIPPHIFRREEKYLTGQVGTRLVRNNVRHLTFRRCLAGEISQREICGFAPPTSAFAVQTRQVRFVNSRCVHQIVPLQTAGCKKTKPGFCRLRAGGNTCARPKSHILINSFASYWMAFFVCVHVNSQSSCK